MPCPAGLGLITSVRRVPFQPTPQIPTGPRGTIASEVPQIGVMSDFQCGSSPAMFNGLGVWYGYNDSEAMIPLISSTSRIS